MKNNIFKLDMSLIVILMIAVLSTGCSSKSTPVATPSLTPIPTMTIQSTSTPTRVPATITSIPPTTTPTSTPALEPPDYLLTVNELPVELYKSHTIEFLQPDGSITYSITFFNAILGHIVNSITVASQPYNKVPDDAVFGNNLIEDSLLGENSVAYKDNGVLYYIFYKGNSLVSITVNLDDNVIAKRGEFTLGEMVNLGKIIDERLPNELLLAPITFPEQLDQAEYNRYFKSLSLAKQDIDNFDLIPTSTFLSTDYIDLSMEFVETPQSLMCAIFDIQEKVYIQKYYPGCHILPINFHAGQFEMRVAVNDKLVAILPFVIQ